MQLCQRGAIFVWLLVLHAPAQKHSEKNINNHKLKSYTSKCGYTNQFLRFLPVTKIWDAALFD